MVKVKKGNTVIQIDNKYLDKYLNDGYCQIGEKGKIIKEANTDESKIVELKKENFSLKGKIVNLEKKITLLEKKSE